MSVIVNGNEIVLSGAVGDFEDFFFAWDHFTKDDVILALAQIGDANDVVIRLNSGGGIATEGAAIHSALARHAGHKTIVVEGIAASAASVIAMAADELVMSLGAVMMIHDPANSTYGTAKDHQKRIEELNAIGDSMASIYAKKSGRTKDQCRDDMRSEIWLTADEAVSLGYANTALAAANDNSAPEPTAFDYRKYANPPERFVALADARAGLKRAMSKAAMSAAIPSQKEPSMADTSADKTANTTNVVDIDAARTQGRSDALAYVREINEICVLAGSPDKAQAFIDKEAKPSDVRKELLDARASADAARQVSNQNAPNNSQKPTAKVDLAADMRRRHGITA